MSTTRKILWTTVVTLSLALGACDKGEEGKTDTKAKAGDAKAGDVKAGDVKAGDAKAGEVKAGDAKVADAKADEAKPDEAKADAFDPRVVKAADLAAKIEAEPARADEILAAAGLDRSSFDALIYEVSTPELAEQYRLARAREAG